MNNLRNWESRRTHQAWGTGSGNPAFMILACIAVNLITLVIALVFALAVTGDGYNDYSHGFGLAIMLPAPAAGLLWALIDVAVCHHSVLDPVYYLSEATILTAANIALGIITIMAYSWDSSSWVPGIFILLTAAGYIYITVVSARLVHKRKTRPQSQGTV
ncbi:hypothetical protein Q7P37_009284 [Cladosporium fusiforme]